MSLLLFLLFIYIISSFYIFRAGVRAFRVRARAELYKGVWGTVCPPCIRHTSSYFVILRHTSSYFVILRHTSSYFGILRHLLVIQQVIDTLGSAVVCLGLSACACVRLCLRLSAACTTMSMRNSTCNVEFSILTLSAVAAGSPAKMVTALLCECLQDFHTCAPSPFSLYVICQEIFTYFWFYFVSFVCRAVPLLDILPPSKMHFCIILVTL